MAGKGHAARLVIMRVVTVTTPAKRSAERTMGLEVLKLDLCSDDESGSEGSVCERKFTGLMVLDVSLRV
jgi:hypothetical protein